MESRVLPLPVVVRSEVDGLPVFSVDGPRPFTAHLVFRVGMYDENIRDRGITHLVEHLALHALRDTEINFNGSVGTHLTTFVAQGHPDEVGEFLRRVARSIHQLPLDRLDVEANVLRREEALRPWSNFNFIMRAYFGLRGPGVAGSPEYGLGWLPAERIEAWAARYFTRENAAVLVVGNPPASFGVELPEGEPVHYQAPQRRPHAPEAPSLYMPQYQGVVWGTLVKIPKGVPHPSFYVGLDIIASRLESRLRHDLGHSYSVSQGWHRIDAEHVAASLGFDCGPEQSRDAALEHLAVMKRFMDEGPDQEELDRALRLHLKAYDDHPHVAAQHHLHDEAETYLAGWGTTTPLEELRGQMEKLTPTEVSERFQEAYRQSYTIADLPEGALTPFKTGARVATAPLAGVQFVSKRKRPRIQPLMIRIGPKGISQRFSDGWFNTPYEEIGLVSVHETGIWVMTDFLGLQFESADYSPSHLLLPPRFRRYIVGLLFAAALISLVLNAKVLAALALIASFPLMLTDGAHAHDGSAMTGEKLAFQEAARRFIPEELILPEPREASAEPGSSAET